MEQIEKPVSRFTAAIVIIGGTGALIATSALDLPLAESVIPIVSGAIASAATFLFMSEKS
ncbi:MAG: hypothetical protein COA77_02505 [Thaumarchaeota archaeon]|nr:MAG: hypothetical protein COA77_02505 [Nitrososphaerota archaeon]